MPNVRLEARNGRIGVIASLVLWLLSVPVLWRALAANEAAEGRGLYHLGRGSAGAGTLHAIAVIWSLAFILLQLLAPLLLGFTLRASYGWRAAVCVSFSAGCALLLDGLGLFAMLIWLRLSVGSG